MLRTLCNCGEAQNSAICFFLLRSDQTSQVAEKVHKNDDKTNRNGDVEALLSDDRADDDEEGGDVFPVLSAEVTNARSSCSTHVQQDRVFSSFRASRWSARVA